MTRYVPALAEAPIHRLLSKPFGGGLMHIPKVNEAMSELDLRGLMAFCNWRLDVGINDPAEELPITEARDRAQSLLQKRANDDEHDK